MDINNVKPGDTVTIRIHNVLMSKAGIEPITVTTKVYEHYDRGLMAAGNLLASVEILEHHPLPTRPEWWGSPVVRCGAIGVDGYFLYNSIGDLYCSSAGVYYSEEDFSGFDVIDCCYIPSQSVR